MKFYSKIFKAKAVVSVFVITWIIILILITINHSLSLVDSRGKLKSVCNFEICEKYIRSSYNNLLKNKKNN